jgi:hypothetical protein
MAEAGGAALNVWMMSHSGSYMGSRSFCKMLKNITS